MAGFFVQTSLIQSLGTFVKRGLLRRDNPWWILLTVVIGTGMPFADTTITNVGRYYIVSGLGVTPYETGWLTAGYSLALAVGIPLAYRLRGFLEEKDLYSLSLLMFIAGSVVVALSNRLSAAMIGRGLEGVAGGVLIPLATTLLQEVFPDRLLPKAQSLFSLSASVWVTLGPTIGGWIIDDIGWRWSFVINVPIGCISMLMAQSFLRNHPRTDPKPFDFPGIFLLATSLGLFFTAYMSAEWFGWHSGFIAHLEMGASVIFCFFLFRSLLFREAILSLEVLENPRFALLVLAVFLQATQSFGRLYLLAPFLEKNDRFQAHHAGAIVAVGAIAEILVSLSFLLHVRNPRQWSLLLASGVFLVAISNVDFLFLPANVFDMAFTVKSQLLFGAGLSLAQISLGPLSRSFLPSNRFRSSATWLLFAQFLGGAWGTMLSRHLVHHIRPVFRLDLPQTSSPAPPLSSLHLLQQIAGEYTANMIFLDLGLLGLLGCVAVLALFLFPGPDDMNPADFGQSSGS